MNIRYLDQDWQIVVVAASGSAEDLRTTLADVSGKSLGEEICVLASDRQELRAVLSETDYPAIFSLPDPVEPGCYWREVLAALDFSRPRVIVLQAGVRVPDKWDARLAAVGQRAQGAWAVAPLNARHPIVSAFYDAGHTPGLPVEAVDQWLNDYVEGTEFEIPVMPESCLLLQGKAWTRLAGGESDQELLERIRMQGGWLVATDQVYVDDSALNGDIDIAWLPQAYLNAFRGRHPLTATRHALMELSGRHEAPRVARTCLPVQLHVGHSWGGGLGRWMEDFIAADRDHNHLVLRSIGDLSAFGQKIALYHSTEMGVPVRSWTLAEPIMSIAQSSYEYNRLLREIVEEYAVESLVVSSLIGHSLDLLRCALPTTFVLHDFFPFCPALYATFGSSCRSCTARDLHECSVKNPLHSFFRFESDVHWLSVRAAFIELLRSDEICAIAPTQSVADRYRQLEPLLSGKTIHIVPHGLDQQLAASLQTVVLEPSITEHGRLRLVVLGRLTAEKGGDLLAEIIEGITEFADVWLLGAGESGERFEGLSCVNVVASYHKTELAELLQRVDPHFGLLLSIVPETFSYTLSELWAAGIPVLATRLGAFSDRINDGENGWLSDIQPRAVLERLRWLDQNRPEIVRVREALRHQEIRSAAAMTADYSALEAVPERIPLARYHLPLRTYQNPYVRREEQKNGRDVQALHIDHQMPYRRVLGDFLNYSAGKMQQTPRINGFLRRSSSRALRYLAGLVAPR